MKEEGVEKEILNYIKKFKIYNYFLLDLSFPSIIKLTKQNEKNIAIRVSEFEPIDGAVRMQEYVKWIWLDCFKGFPLSKEEVIRVNELNMKVCMVSPELHGFPRSEKDIFPFQKKINEFGLKIDAVCTKYPKLW